MPAAAAATTADAPPGQPPGDTGSTIGSANKHLAARVRGDGLPKAQGGVEESIEIEFGDRVLRLSLCWEDEEELAPLFSGACWAGTIVWQAALDLCDYISREHTAQLARGATVVELGCGIGVPGMVAHLLGASALLTEQAELLGLLRRNINTNFNTNFNNIASGTTITHTADRGSAAGSSSSNGHRSSTEEPPFIRAAQLDWGCDDVRALVESHFGGRAPDLVLCADCIYEPLYGDSWRALVVVLRALCDTPRTRALVSVERRTADGVDHFLDAARDAGLRPRLAHSSTAAGVPIELYEMALAAPP